jgi:thioredoxin-related protein
VLDKAKSLGKYIYLDISAEWCVPCQLMKRDVYTHQETADYFKTNFVNYLVDVQKGEGPDLKIIFNVSSFPTLLILDEKGREIRRHEGAYYHRDLINFAQSALDSKK